MEFFNINKITCLIRRNLNFLIITMISGIIVGIIYAIFIFNPIYTSKACLLINKTEQNSSTNMAGFIPTQKELLKSDKILKKVWQKLKSEQRLDIDNNKGIEKLEEAISITNPKNTNIIVINVSWNSPKIAASIASSLISEYETLKKSLETTNTTKKHSAVNKKLKEAEDRLLLVRNQIKDFRKTNSITNLKLETDGITQQIINLENQKAQLNSKTFLEKEKITTIAKTLKLDEKKILNTSVNWQKGNLENLFTKLENLQDEQASLSSRYTEAHPYRINVQSRINRIEKQIQEQIKLNLIGLEKQNICLLSAPSNARILEALISSKTKYAELKTLSENINNELNDLKLRRESLPEKQLVMVSFIKKEASLSEIVNDLRFKQAQTELKEATSTSGVSIISQPKIPFKHSFPGRLEVIFLAIWISTIVASKVITAKEIFRNKYDHPEQIEKDLKTPILGIIPWLNKDLYEEPDIMFAIEETASFYSLAFQKTVSSLRIKGNSSDKKALTFTSSGFSKNRSTIIMNTAYSLSRTGQSVVVVDADFRTPTIDKELGFEISNKYSLSELLAELTKDLQEEKQPDNEKINFYVRSIPGVNNFFIIPNNTNIADPGEYLYSEAFTLLVKELKKRYNWVLIDTPPAAVVPDALAIGLQTDGVILLTGFEENKQNLKKLYNQFKNYGVEIFGIVAREFRPDELISANEYFKQVFSRLISKDENVQPNN